MTLQIWQKMENWQRLCIPYSKSRSILNVHICSVIRQWSIHSLRENIKICYLHSNCCVFQWLWFIFLRPHPYRDLSPNSVRQNTRLSSFSVLQGMSAQLKYVFPQTAKNEQIPGHLQNCFEAKHMDFWGFQLFNGILENTHTIQIYCSKRQQYIIKKKRQQKKFFTKTLLVEKKKDNLT